MTALASTLPAAAVSGRRTGDPQDRHNFETQPKRAGHEQQRVPQQVGLRPGAPRDGADKPRGGLLSLGCSRALAALGLLLVLASTAVAQDSPAGQGELALGEGRYSDAIHLYLAAQERDGPGAHLLASLGDAYAGAGDVGRAVLSYERALILAPRDRPVRDRLEGLRRRAELPSDLGRGWRDFHRYLTRLEWTVAGIAAAGLLLAALAGRRRLARPAVVRLTLIWLLTALPAATANARLVFERDRAVVVAAEPVDLLLEPHEQAEATGSLRPGKVVWITRCLVDFARVRTPQGAVGWIPRADVEPVNP